MTTVGGMWHTIRHALSWDGFGDVKIPAGHHPGAFTSVACAEVGGELHVCGVTTDGGMWHAIRRADGSWIGFGDVKGQAGTYPGAFTGRRLRRSRRRTSRLRGHHRRPHLAHHPPRPIPGTDSATSRARPPESIRRLHHRCLRRLRPRPTRLRGHHRRRYVAHHPPRLILGRIRRRQDPGWSPPRRLHRRGLRPRLTAPNSSARSTPPSRKGLIRRTSQRRRRRRVRKLGPRLRGLAVLKVEHAAEPLPALSGCLLDDLCLGRDELVAEALVRRSSW